MRELKFTVDKQLLQKDPSCDFSNIAPGTSGYLFAKFTFSPEWNDCAKAAAFWRGDEEYAVLLEDDACEIPAEALTENKFRVSVSGARADYYRITTTSTTVKQEG